MMMMTTARFEKTTDKGEEEKPMSEALRRRHAWIWIGNVCKTSTVVNNNIHSTALVYVCYSLGVEERSLSLCGSLPGRHVLRRNASRSLKNCHCETWVHFVIRAVSRADLQVHNNTTRRTTSGYFRRATPSYSRVHGHGVAEVRLFFYRSVGVRWFTIRLIHVNELIDLIRSLN